MANFKEEIRLTVVNADISQERQTALKERLKESFQGLSQDSSDKDYNLIFINNQDNRPVSNVLVANPKADVILSGFNVTRKSRKGKGKKAEEQAMITEDTGGDLSIDPTIRFEAYRELKAIVSRESFRLRRLIFVGDLNERIREFLKYGFEVQVVLFKDDQRVEKTHPMTLDEHSLPIPGGRPEGHQIDVGMIDRLVIGEIEFDGVINMTVDEMGHFLMPDFTADDSVQKMLGLEAVKQEFIAEKIEEEKSLFVRKKKVMLVLSQDLMRLVAQKLRFDEMEEVFEFSSVEEALASLSVGQATDIATYLEQNGFDFLLKILNAKERDRLLMGLMGPRLLPNILSKECQTFGKMASHLTEKHLQEILMNFSEKMIDRLIHRLIEKSITSFLSRIKQGIREPLILEFLKDPVFAMAGLKSLPPTLRAQYIKRNCPEILGTLFLIDSTHFRTKFKDVALDKDYNSSKDYAALSPADRNMRLGIYKEKLAGEKMGPEDLEKKIGGKEYDKAVGTFIGFNAEAFFNDLDAALRKKLWHEIGEKGKKEIAKKLHHADKLSILEGSKDQTFEVLAKDHSFLASLVKQGEELEGAGLFLLGLKQFNKVESKTGLLKRLANDPKLKEHRLEQIAKLLATPEGKPIYEKITMEVESLKAGYDALICLQRDINELRSHDELKDAKVTLVDELVDASLLEMFEKGSVDVDAYQKHQAKIKQKLDEMIAQLKAQGGEDPVGSYLIETMVIMMNMTGKAMQNKLDPTMIDQLDERQKIKDEVIQKVAAKLAEIIAQIESAKKELPLLDEKSKKLADYLERQAETVNRHLEVLQLRMGQFGEVKTRLNKAQANKIHVAKVQQQLSHKFFELIRPLILDKLSILPAGVAKMLSNLKGRLSNSMEGQRRLIFRFTDDELERIAKRNIVFCTTNEILKRFIVTCLNIDSLSETLFTIANPHNIPDEPDVLFISDELRGQSFDEVIDGKYLVTFADQGFYQTLMVNEKNKGIIRKQLDQLGTHKAKLKSFLESEGGKLKKMAATKKNFESQVKTIKAQKKHIAQTTKDNIEKKAFLEAEKDNLTEKFGEIDGQFQSAKEAIRQAVESGGSVLDSIAQESEGINKGLSETLLKINKQMAGLMFLKNVGDTAEHISRATQENIALKMTEHTKIKGGRHAVSELVITHDGTLSGGEQAKRIEEVARQYFGSGLDQRSVQMGRMEAEIMESGKQPNLVIILAGEDKTNLGNLRDLVKRLKIKSLKTHYVIFGNYGVEENSPELVENMNSIRNYAMLINTSMVDYGNPSKIRQFFEEIAPS